MRETTTTPIVDVDEVADRPGWAVVTLGGTFSTPRASQVLAATLDDLLHEGVDTLTLDAGACGGLSPAACHVLVDAARRAHDAGGCLVAAGLADEDQAILGRYDLTRRLGLIC